jgi:hypothetical protein
LGLKRNKSPELGAKSPEDSPEIVPAAQIRDFARTKLGRNKTDGVDASHS